jgi:hypothetical protein
MEVMTALTITALVATLAAAALHAGIDVRERVARHRETLEAEGRAVSWIGSMLRHPPPASAVDEAMFTIVHERSAGGDRLTFLSQGVEPPLGVGPVWRVLMEVRADGLHVHAEPANASTNRIPLETILPQVTSLGVLALDASDGGIGAAWRSDWPVLRTAPRAVSLVFSTNDGVVRAPFVFTTILVAGDGQ